MCICVCVCACVRACVRACLSMGTNVHACIDLLELWPFYLFEHYPSDKIQNKHLLGRETLDHSHLVETIVKLSYLFSQKTTLISFVLFC